MRIGNSILKNRVLAAPLAGVTNKTFRILAKEKGCALTFTEMISANGVAFNNAKTHELFNLAEEPPPVAIQIFGSDPVTLAKAAEIVSKQRPLLVDINLGCPAPKIVKNNEGSALMKDPVLVGKIVSLVVKAVDVPVSVKIRSGWSLEKINAVEIARIAEQCGVAAITVHARTRCQYYSGKADWEVIKQVKKAVRVPVIGNGDIWSPPDAKGMLEQTDCDFVMIGRAAMGNPWIFERTVHYLNTGELVALPSPSQKVEMGIRHLKMLVEEKGQDTAIKEMRKHLAWYFKGLRNSAKMREEINKIDCFRELLAKLYQYLDEV